MNADVQTAGSKQPLDFHRPRPPIDWRSPAVLLGMFSAGTCAGFVIGLSCGEWIQTALKMVEYSRGQY